MPGHQDDIGPDVHVKSDLTGGQSALELKDELRKRDLEYQNNVYNNEANYI